MITLTEWMAAGRDADTCLSAAGASPLTYAVLRQLSVYVQQSMNVVGVGRNDRVALVLPNSAEMAASFVTVAACCTSAPLNPAYRADEFEFYLNDLNAKALIVEAGSSSPAIEVARKLGVSILVLHPTPANGAGSFTLDTSARAAAAPAHRPVWRPYRSSLDRWASGRRPSARRRRRTLRVDTLRACDRAWYSRFITTKACR
jgi:acyl-CoA synthetase (AMP-forming)/AMP-acid ligase II